MFYVKRNKPNMNWEIVVASKAKLDLVLEAAKGKFPHNCRTEIESFEKNDGGPYGSLNNATHYDIEVAIPEGTDPRFVQGIKDVLAAL